MHRTRPQNRRRRRNVAATHWIHDVVASPTTSKHWAHKAYDATVGAALRTINSPWSVEAIDSVNAKYMRSQRRDKLKKGKGESWERCEAHVGNRDDCEKDRCYYDSHADRCVPPQFGAQLKKEYLKQTLREGGEEFSAAESKRQRRRRQFLEDAKGDRYWKVTKRRRRPRQAIEANARNGLVTKKKKGHGDFEGYQAPELYIAGCRSHGH